MIRKDIKDFINTIPSNITLVGATKYGDINDLKELYNAGISNFGENHVDSFLNKYEALKDLNIKWHFIGHLQRNKAELVINKIDYLHSLDSLELAKLINKYRDKPLDCFIEVSINLEDNKEDVVTEKLLTTDEKEKLVRYERLLKGGVNSKEEYKEKVEEIMK